MGKRGPPRTPMRVLKQHDSPVAKERAKQGVATPRPGRPNCPRDLPEGARKYWRHAVDLLYDMGILEKADRNALSRYCVNLWFYQRTRDFVAEHLDVPVVNGQGVEVERPQVKRLLAFDTACRRAEQEFGLTPSARSTLLRAGVGKKKGGGGKPSGKARFA